MLINKDASRIYIPTTTALSSQLLYMCLRVVIYTLHNEESRNTLLHFCILLKSASVCVISSRVGVSRPNIYIDKNGTLTSW